MHRADEQFLLLSRTGRYSPGTHARSAHRPSQPVPRVHARDAPRLSAVGRMRLAVADALVSVAFVIAGPGRELPTGDR